MLDVHVLTLPGLPEEWIEERRASIAEAAAQAGYPVVVHEVDGIPDHLGRSRRKGYTCGVQPYVTHVDHDDYVRPNAFKVLAPLLFEGVDAITTGEVHIRGNRVTESPTSLHHLAVFKRALVNAAPLDRMRHFPDQLLMALYPGVHVSECVYVHRIRVDSSSRKAREADAEGAREERRLIAKPSLLAVELMTPTQIADEIEEWING